MRFEYEKSPLHTFVYGGTGTGKAYFIRQYLKFYQDHDQNQDNKNMVEHDRRSIIVVCKDERDYINPETGKPYCEFNMCVINMVT